MKIGAMESLNALEEKMRKSKEYNSEEHSNSNCHYLILYEFHIKKYTFTERNNISRDM